jgi:hypothetical protein
MARRIIFGAVALTATVAIAGPASACGGLVGENGTISLTKTTTLAAYHDGVERYVTSFEFAGEGAEVGSIIPLPDVPTDVVRGGDWTLQRLVREVTPVREFALADGAAATTAASAEVILETKIDALDITVLKGGAQEVGKWALDHGFFLTPDAPEVLEFYAKRSPVFMAARFDAARAKQLGQRSGDGTPIMLTIPTDEPWVPLRILGLGAKPREQINADVFLLTDDKPQLFAGTHGLNLQRSQRASTSLLSDLRSDKGMEWVPSRMWLNYLQVDSDAGDLAYDLAISTHADAAPSLSDAGISVVGGLLGNSSNSYAPWYALTGAGLALMTVAVFVLRRRAALSAT